MKSIVVLYGGVSTEHEIALRSARSVLNNLNRDNYIVYGVYIDKSGRFSQAHLITEPVETPESLMEVITESHLTSISRFCLFLDTLDDVIVFPLIHGQQGENGEIQGFLESLQVNYVGNRLMASALCMDKGYANMVMAANGIPEAKFYVLSLDRYRLRPWTEIEAEILNTCGNRLFVKPCNNGSSVGVTRARKANLKSAIDHAFRYDNRILIEEEIIGNELEVSIIGNVDAKASDPGSYTYATDMLDYDAKYNDRATVENVPHPLSPEKNAQIKALALQTYHALSCEGLARVDIFMDREGRFFVNEVNTLPGMTPSSLAPKLWTQLTDMTIEEYLDALIESAIDSQQYYSRIETSWGK